MKLPYILVLATLAGGAAVADDEKALPPASDDAAARICKSYGPGYQLVAETGVCIRISGYVDVTVGISPGNGSSGK